MRDTPKEIAKILRKSGVYRAPSLIVSRIPYAHGLNAWQFSEEWELAGILEHPPCLDEDAPALRERIDAEIAEILEEGLRLAGLKITKNGRVSTINPIQTT